MTLHILDTKEGQIPRDFRRVSLPIKDYGFRQNSTLHPLSDSRMTIVKFIHCIHTYFFIYELQLYVHNDQGERMRQAHMWIDMFDEP